MKYRLAIFDFDGTLADSFPFFVRVINQLAEQHGFKKVDLDLVPT
jgi:phosphoglycolate phosphatase